MTIILLTLALDSAFHFSSLRQMRLLPSHWVVYANQSPATMCVKYLTVQNLLSRPLYHKLLISRAIGYGMWIPLASFGEWRSNLTSLFKNVGNAKAAEWICPETTITNCIQHRQFNQLYLHGYAIESWKASHVSILNCDVHLQQFSAENFPTSDKKDTEI